VVTARLDCAGLGCQVALSRVRGSDGSVLWIHDFGLAIDDLRLLTNSVAQNLRTGYPGRDLRRDVPDLEVRSEDYEEYLRLRSDFHLRQEAVPLDQLLERLAAIRRTSPRFLEAYVLEAQIARYKFAASRDPEDLDRAFAAVAEARKLAPEDPQPLFNLFMLDLAGKRLDQAEEVLDELARLRPGDATVLAKRAMLEDERGNAQQALALMRTAAARRPSWNNLYNLALVEYRHGELAAARGHLQESLARSPGDFRSRYFLAQLELLSGRAEAVGLYEELADGSSDSRTLNNLGMAYLLMQRYAEAASCFRRSLELEPGAWESTLSLGQAELLLGREKEAEALYRRVLSLLDQDAAASDHYALAVRAEALARLGQLRQAATATQEALRLAPDHPFVAYQAALVYALIGDRVSALASTEKALSLGLGRRWFSLPWFDSLRSEADFRALLQAAEDPASKRQQAGEGSPTG
jgi:serine/threonine-protein kinase